METRITQCPRCGTSFRVTAALLAVAAGAVRCGSCLHIFNARDHWLDTEPRTPAPTETFDDSPPSRFAPARPVIEDDDEHEPEIDEDGLFDDDTPLFRDQPKDTADSGYSGDRSIFNPGDTDFSPIDDEQGSQAFDNFDAGDDWLTPHTITFDDTTDTEPADSDEDWAEALLKDDTSTPADESPATHSDDGLAVEELSFLTDYEITFGTETVSPDTGDDASSGITTAIDDTVLDLPTALDPGLRDSAPATDEQAPDEPAAEETGNDFPAEAASEAGDARASIAAALAEMESFSAGERIGTESRRRPGADEIATAPLHTHAFARPRRWPGMLWGIGLVVALALLPLQYVYFNYDAIARGPLRPWLAQACDLVGCRLPPRSDPALIRTGSLIVRSHPTVPGALAVDAIVTNVATFAQPYPDLVLQFTDINGKPVAGRRFHPAEYLGGELTGARLMPVGRPIHIGLAIRDPGPKAVNYLLAVAPPQA